MADQLQHQHDQAKEEDTSVGGLCGLLIKKVGGGHDHNHDQKQQIPTDNHDVPMTNTEEQYLPNPDHLHDQGEVKHGGNPSLADHLHLSHHTTDTEVKHGGNPSQLPDADHLHPSHGSSSDEEEGEGGGEKKEKKKAAGLKEKIKNKLTGGDHEKEDDEALISADHDQHHKAEQDEAVVEEKGFLEKFMDKLPLYGQEIPDNHHHDNEAAGNGDVLESADGHKEKGIMEKIKDKIPHVTTTHKTTGDDHSEAKKDD